MSMSTIRSQATFASTTHCATFSPNRLKPDICTDCFSKIFSHSSKSVKEDQQIKAALEYSNKGRKTPSTILTNLYLGGFASVLNKSFLKQSNITGIVNTAKGLDMFGPKWIKGLKRVKEMGIECLELNWMDSEDQNISEIDLVTAIHFIQRHRDNGGGVIVHCAQGKSRSTSCVLAYLLSLTRFENTSIDTALEFVQTKRMMAQPNRNFIKQLKAHEKNQLFQRLQEKKKKKKKITKENTPETKEETKENIKKPLSKPNVEIPTTATTTIAPPLNLSNAKDAALDLINVVDSVMHTCPWTQIKTFDQMIEYTQSELNEIKEATTTRKTTNSLVQSSDDLESELGDLLFDALLMTRICERDYEHVTLQGALQRAVEKITRRCPHVFGNEKISTPAEAAAIWQREKLIEKMKEKEKERKRSGEGGGEGGGEVVQGE